MKSKREKIYVGEKYRKKNTEMFKCPKNILLAKKECYNLLGKKKFCQKKEAKSNNLVKNVMRILHIQEYNGLTICYLILMNAIFSL